MVLAPVHNPLVRPHTNKVEGLPNHVDACHHWPPCVARFGLCVHSGLAVHAVQTITFLLSDYSIAYEGDPRCRPGYSFQVGIVVSALSFVSKLSMRASTDKLLVNSPALTCSGSILEGDQRGVSV